MEMDNGIRDFQFHIFNRQKGGKIMSEMFLGRGQASWGILSLVRSRKGRFVSDWQPLRS